MLEWLRLDTAGDRKGDNVPVFSNEAGEPRKAFKKGWVVAVLKAHGVDLRWRKGRQKDYSGRVSTAVHPQMLLGVDDPVGPENEATLREWVVQAELVVAAWGTIGCRRPRNVSARGSSRSSK